MGIKEKELHDPAGKTRKMRRIQRKEKARRKETNRLNREGTAKERPRSLQWWLRAGS